MSLLAFALSPVHQQYLLGARQMHALSFAVRIREHAHDSMRPVWEANHVWLIFVLTVFWTAYPAALGSIASTLAGQPELEDAFRIRALRAGVIAGALALAASPRCIRKLTRSITSSSPAKRCPP
jgi:cytochrome d ubiquinol oxidase subunit II